MNATTCAERYSLLRRYGFAALCILSATLLCWASGRVVNSQIPFMLFILATVLAAWYGDLGAGLAALVAGVILGDYVFLSPPGSSEHHGPAEMTLLLTYGGTTLVAVLLIHALRKARCLAQQAASDAADRARQLEQEMAEHRRARESLQQVNQDLRALVEAAPLAPFATNMADREKAARALAETERMYRCLVEESLVGIYLIQDGHFLYGNARLAQILGYAQNEIAGRPVPDLVARDDRHLVIDNLHKRLCGQIQSIQYTFRALRKDGRAIDVEVMGTTTLYNGKPAVLGSLLDITDRKLAEEQLRKSKEAAEAADRAKDRFLAVLSHELRTPLTPVLAAAALMQQDRSLPAEVLADLGMIQRNVALEATLIDDLLDITRISKGKLELHVETVDIRALLHRTVEICAADIAAGRLHLTLDIDHGPRCMRGDPSRLQQVFWNLLRNAIKFTPEAGRIAIRCSDGSGNGSRIPGVDCFPPPAPGFCPDIPNPDRRARSIIVEVTDSGIGIEPDQIGRLFEAFEQGDRAVTRKFGGLGLGLAICKALVDLHGGHITATSPGRGHGATFRVELPVCSLQLPACESTKVGPTSQPAGRHTPRRNLRLLLVEDHPDTARVMAQLLRHEGHSVQVAHDVASALDLASRCEFDILISDLGLPDGSGLDLMRQLGAHERHPRAIALSGYGMEDDIRQSREAGFVEHLTKPVDLDRLQAALIRAAEA